MPRDNNGLSQYVSPLNAGISFEDFVFIEIKINVVNVVICFWCCRDFMVLRAKVFDIDCD